MSALNLLLNPDTFYIPAAVALRELMTGSDVLTAATKGFAGFPIDCVHDTRASLAQFGALLRPLFPCDVVNIIVS